MQIMMLDQILYPKKNMPEKFGNIEIQPTDWSILVTAKFIQVDNCGYVRENT